jgi:hypothetical protein
MIKFVKKAGCWCVSKITGQGTKEHKQEQKWFSTEKEAREYDKDQKDKRESSRTQR